VFNNGYENMIFKDEQKLNQNALNQIIK